MKRDFYADKTEFLGEKKERFFIPKNRLKIK